MKKCKICGKKLWEGQSEICERTECFIQNEFLKKKKLEELKLFHNILAPESKKVFTLFPVRTWTASCVDNLYNNMEKKWSIERTAKETKRTVDEIKYMQKILKEVGYKNIKKVLVKIEKCKDKSKITKEIEYLKEIGLYYFFKGLY